METFETIESNCEEGPFEILKKIRINNLNKVAVGHININSIRNKFDMLSSMAKDNIDILMVSETKLCGGILLFIGEDIPTKIISITLLKDFEGIFVELNFRKKKILLCCSYNPHKNLTQIIRIFLEKYWIYANENIPQFAYCRSFQFCGTYHLHNLIKDPTCFKNPDKPSCIDLLLTNFPKSFLKSPTLETGLSDFHKLTLTVLKIHYKSH